MRFTHQRMALSSRRRAFATVMAVVMIGVVAVSLAAVAASFTADYRRTQNARSDAQLRQLLCAGAIDAVERSKSLPVDVPTERFDVPIPSELAGRNCRLFIDLASQRDGISAQITAQVNEQTAQQTVAFARKGGAWKVASAFYDRTGWALGRDNTRRGMEIGAGAGR